GDGEVKGKVLPVTPEVTAQGVKMGEVEGARKTREGRVSLSLSSSSSLLNGKRGIGEEALVGDVANGRDVVDGVQNGVGAGDVGVGIVGVSVGVGAEEVERKTKRKKRKRRKCREQQQQQQPQPQPQPQAEEGLTRLLEGKGLLELQEHGGIGHGGVHKKVISGGGEVLGNAGPPFVLSSPPPPTNMELSSKVTGNDVNGHVGNGNGGMEGAGGVRRPREIMSSVGGLPTEGGESDSDKGLRGSGSAAADAADDLKERNGVNGIGLVGDRSTTTTAGAATRGHSMGQVDGSSGCGATERYPLASAGAGSGGVSGDGGTGGTGEGEWAGTGKL
ncbi:unnamed protein product, partial [Choristocarpus tenellus]